MYLKILFLIMKFGRQLNNGTIKRINKTSKLKDLMSSIQKNLKKQGLLLYSMKLIRYNVFVKKAAQGRFNSFSILWSSLPAEALLSYCYLRNQIYNIQIIFLGLEWANSLQKFVFKLIPNKIFLKCSQNKIQRKMCKN